MGAYGEITFSTEAVTYSGSSCSLELTDVPQHTLIEFKINYYNQPESCICDKGNSPNCSQIFIEQSYSNKSLCDKPTEPIYIYQSSEDNPTITLSGIEKNRDYNFSIIYSGEFGENFC